MRKPLTLVSILPFVFGLLLIPSSAFASTQIIYTTTASNTLSNSVIGYLPVEADITYLSANANYMPQMSVAGTIKNLRVQLSAAPGGSASYAVTFYRNGSGTSLTCTASGSNTTCTDLSDAVTVSPGDEVEFQISPSSTPTAAVFSASIDFVPTTANDTALLAQGGSMSSSVVDYFSATGGRVPPSTTLQNKSQVVLPEAGTISSLYWSEGSNTGASPKRLVMALIQNVTTTGLTCTASGASTHSCNDTSDSVSVSQDDLLSISTTPSNSPSVNFQGWGMRFVPSTAGDFVTTMTTSNADSTGSTVYQPLAATSGILADTTESDVQVPTSAATFTRLSVVLPSAPTGVKSRTFTLRDNGVSTALTCTVSGAATSCSATGSVSVSAGDLLDTSDTPSGSPSTVTGANIGYVANVPSGGLTGGPTGSAQFRLGGGIFKLFGGSFRIF